VSQKRNERLKVVSRAMKQQPEQSTTAKEEKENKES
jgi:hypothetical protein